MSVPRRDRIGVADPQRFGGDPRARWLDSGTALRKDWGEIEYVPAKQLAEAVEDLREALDMLDNAASSFRDPTLRRTWGQKRKALCAKWGR
jgi:hypothetical protein